MTFASFLARKTAYGIFMFLVGVIALITVPIWGPALALLEWYAEQYVLWEHQQKAKQEKL